MTLAFLSTFLVSTPLLRLLLMGLVCVTATLVLRPFASPGAQRLQTQLQVCLLVVSMCNIVPASQVELGGVSGGGSAASVSPASQGLLAVLEVVFVYVLPIAAVLSSVPVGGLINPLLVLFR